MLTSDAAPRTRSVDGAAVAGIAAVRQGRRRDRRRSAADPHARDVHRHGLPLAALVGQGGGRGHGTRPLPRAARPLAGANGLHPRPVEREGQQWRHPLHADGQHSQRRPDGEEGGPHGRELRPGDGAEDRRPHEDPVARARLRGYGAWSAGWASAALRLAHFVELGRVADLDGDAAGARLRPALPHRPRPRGSPRGRRRAGRRQVARAAALRVGPAAVRGISRQRPRDRGPHQAGRQGAGRRRLEADPRRPRSGTAGRRHPARATGILAAHERHPPARLPHRLHADRDHEVLQRCLDHRALPPRDPRQPSLSRPHPARHADHAQPVFHVAAGLPLRADVGGQRGRTHAARQHGDHALFEHAARQS